MYADKPMRGHGLMQAIARVNRVFRDKPGGLVVDYLGLADQLKHALATYTESGGQGDPSIDTAKAIAVMLEKHEIACDMMHGFNWEKWTTGTPPRSWRYSRRTGAHPRTGGRQRTLCAGGDRPSRAFALCAGTDEAIEIRDDIGFFQAVKAALAKKRGERKSAEELDAAVRQLVSKAIATEGEIIDVFHRRRIEAAGHQHSVRPIPRRSARPEIQERRRRAAGEAARDEIKMRSKRNLVQSREFSEMLKKTLNAYHNRAIATQEVIEELIKLAKEMSAADKRGVDLGLNDDEVAFYDALAANNSAVEAMGNDKLKVIAAELVTQVARA